MQLKTRGEFRAARHRRVRRKISGTQARPRLAIFKSGTSLQVQVIDDEQGITLLSARAGGSKNIESASQLGKQIAEAAQAKNIDQVVVDRGGFPFHGRVKAIVDAAVEAGLSIGKTAEPVQDASTEDK